MLSGIALLFICVAANAITKPTAGKPAKDDVAKNIHRYHYQQQCQQFDKRFGRRSAI